MRLICRWLAVVCLTLTLSGCVSTSAPVDECAWAKPISWHEDDTPTTKQEVFAHNLKWEKFCLR